MASWDKVCPSLPCSCWRLSIFTACLRNALARPKSALSLVSFIALLTRSDRRLISLGALCFDLASHASHTEEHWRFDGSLFGTESTPPPSLRYLFCLGLNFNLPVLTVHRAVRHASLHSCSQNYVQESSLSLSLWLVRRSILPSIRHFMGEILCKWLSLPSFSRQPVTLRHFFLFQSCSFSAAGELCVPRLWRVLRYQRRLSSCLQICPVPPFQRSPSQCRHSAAGLLGSCSASIL